MSKNDLVESILKLREEKEKFSISESTKDFVNDMVWGIHRELKAIREEYIKCKEDNINLKASIEEMKSNYVDKKKIVSLEKALYYSLQYNRRSNLEISGIPDIFKDDVLEKKVIDILDIYGVTISPDEIIACHRLPRSRNNDEPKKTIIRFLNRKKKEEIMSKKRDQVDLSSLGFPEEAKLYFSDNLNPFYNNIWYNCRKLKKEKIVVYAWIDNGSIKVRRDTNSNVIKIEHLDDLKSNFPNFVCSEAKEMS